MIEPEAMKRLASAIASLEQGNHAAAERDLAYAAEEWPNQCDVHRALAYSRQTRLQVPTEARAIAKIRTALGTFDEMIASIPGGSVEDSFTINWSMPLVPVIFPLATRGQVRAAYASQLVEDKQYDEAFDELKAARNEKLFNKALAGTTAKEIAAVECLLYYRTDGGMT
ncbi:Uncharacterised protein [Mycobacteroides abscessus]|nr:hypothetical protein [Mycobacteroides abscessus]CQA01751.1 Uncharacterised protein [Mycobacteroides abscessus]